MKTGIGDKRIKAVCLLMVLQVLVAVDRLQAQPRLRLFYSEPAQTWEEALPLGNGRVGAMVYGGATQEHIQFNQDTLWTGKPRSYAHPGAYKHLEKIRQLLFAGKQREAQDLMGESFMSVPRSKPDTLKITSPCSNAFESVLPAMKGT